MKKYEANTLEEAYAQATKEFHCSITELDCEIVQYPSAGFLGMFSKQAIIVVAKKHDATKAKPEEDDAPAEAIEVAKEDKLDSKKQVSNEPVEGENLEDLGAKDKTVKKEYVTKDSIVDDFFGKSKQETVEEVEAVKDIDNQIPIAENNISLQEEIEKELKNLINTSCFDIDIVEVDVIEDTAYVFMDGEDVALLIGKEGYRYNALSYIISNWLQNQHNLYLKLEIAQFLASQQEMIRSYMEPVIEHVQEQGWGRTRALDGVLVQIALEQLREEFPNKYVAIKRTRNGDRYVLINEFNKK